MDEGVNTPFRFGPFELTPGSGELRKSGIPLRVSGQVLDVLLLLASHPGKIVTREELRQKLWGDATFVDFEHGLNAAVNRLREILGDSASTPKYIETIPRRGYRFIESAVDTPHTDPKPGSDTKALDQPRIVRSPSVLWIATLLSAAILGGLFFLFRTRPDGEWPDLQRMKIRKVTEDGNVSHLAVSPDGRYIAYVLWEGDQCSLLLQQVETGARVLLIAPESSYLFGLALSPDSNFVYYARSTQSDNGWSNLYRIPALGGSSILVMRNVDSPPSFSPDGRKFAFARGLASNRVEVRVAKLDGTVDSLITSFGPAEIGSIAGPAWSPDGMVVALPIEFTSEAPKFILEAISLRDGKSREVFTSPNRIGRPRWTRDGQHLIAAIEDADQRGQLWIISYAQGEARRLSNDLADYAVEIDTNSDARLVGAIQETTRAQIWSMPGGRVSVLQQLTFGEEAFVHLAPGMNGKYLAVSSAGELWMMKLDGSLRLKFPDLTNVQEAFWCGNYVVASTVRSGATDLLRVDADGSKQRLLTGAFVSARCSTDSRSIYAAETTSTNKIVRIPVDGGTPISVGNIVGEGFYGHLLLSPNGDSLIYRFADHPGDLKLATMALAGGPAKVTDFHGPWGGAWHWSPDGKSLQYIVTAGGVSNIWEQSPRTSQPRQVTHFTSDYIFDFAWTPDGKELLVSRGTQGGDALLINNFRR
jgi:DNA-binding winged helix-turn-helix (wHTH) protein/Tol biopolymer transport system component